MKVIFLDIDGVIVTASHLADLHASGKRVADHNGLHRFDPRCVKNFVKILDATGAKIVLSSSWKMFGKDMFDRLWETRKMPGEIMDFTVNLMGGRGHEIARWLRDHDNVESFVIIDDTVSDLLRNQTDRTVHTTWEDGLTNELADVAIRILNTPIEREED